MKNIIRNPVKEWLLCADVCCKLMWLSYRSCFRGTAWEGPLTVLALCPEGRLLYSQTSVLKFMAAVCLSGWYQESVYVLKGADDWVSTCLAVVLAVFPHSAVPFPPALSTVYGVWTVWYKVAHISMKSVVLSLFSDECPFNTTWMLFDYIISTKMEN